ncbi:MAG: UbiX family flavin prenyltransferase [Lentisphaeraceae bacterium]|nr:UbiX family flavin prenyltransferase [Lentisphaeraceae bacterium]
MSSGKRYVVGVSGASGSPYAASAIRALIGLGHVVHVVFTPIAKQVWTHELDESISSFVDTFSESEKSRLIIENNSNLGAAISSGSFRHDGMLVVPCSVKCLAGIANGYAGSLIERAADVSLKERFPLVLAIRETPLNLIHIENMAKVTKAGAIVLPASPGFYHKNTTAQGLIDFVAGKALDLLGETEHDLFTRWKSEDITGESDA